MSRRISTLLADACGAGVAGARDVADRLPMPAHGHLAGRLDAALVVAEDKIASQRAEIDRLKAEMDRLIAKGGELLRSRDAMRRVSASLSPEKRLAAARCLERIQQARRDAALAEFAMTESLQAYREGQREKIISDSDALDLAIKMVGGEVFALQMLNHLRAGLKDIGLDMAYERIMGRNINEEIT